MIDFIPHLLCRVCPGRGEFILQPLRTLTQVLGYRLKLFLVFFFIEVFILRLFRSLAIGEVTDKEDGDARRNTTEAPRKTPRAAGERGFPKAPRWYSDERSRLPAEYVDRFRRVIRQAPTEYPQATAEYKLGIHFEYFEYFELEN